MILNHPRFCNKKTVYEKEKKCIQISTILLLEQVIDIKF